MKVILLSIILMMVVNAQTTMNFWWNKNQYNAYNITLTPETKSQPSGDKSIYEMYDGPLYNQKGIPIGEVVFINSLITRSGALYVLGDCTFFFNNTNMENGFGSSVRFLDNFLSNSGTSYWPANLHLSYISVSTSGAYFGNTYLLELVTSANGDRNVTMTILYPNTNTTFFALSAGAKAGIAIATIIAAIAIALNVYLYYNRRAPLSSMNREHEKRDNPTL